MRTSKLGMLYDKEQQVRPDLDKVVQDFMDEFEAFISFNEKLPIYSSSFNKQYDDLEIQYIINHFLVLGCTVKYEMVKSPYGKCRFILTELS